MASLRRSTSVPPEFENAYRDNSTHGRRLGRKRLAQSVDALRHEVRSGEVIEFITPSGWGVVAVTVTRVVQVCRGKVQAAFDRSAIRSVDIEPADLGYSVTIRGPGGALGEPVCFHDLGQAQHFAMLVGAQAPATAAGQSEPRPAASALDAGAQTADVRGADGRDTVALHTNAPAGWIDPMTGELQSQFEDAVTRGDLQRASDLVDQHGAAPDAAGGTSLLERASATRRALSEQRLDDAASIMSAWEVPFPGMSTPLPERLAMMGELNALGLVLMDYFQHPAARDHPRYDDLMDGKLRSVAKATRLAIPGSGQSFFDRVYARVKSQRAIDRARGA